MYVRVRVQDKACLVRLIKELQRRGATGEKGDFKDWVKATQPSKRSTWRGGANEQTTTPA